jgi:hypothetical protein
MGNHDPYSNNTRLQWFFDHRLPIVKITRRCNNNSFAAAEPAVYFDAAFDFTPNNDRYAPGKAVAH